MRSDKYLVWSWLKNLSVDFATDLVKDSSEALQKLQDFSNGKTCNEMGSFNFDVVSLYDSLSPDLILEAFNHAATFLRPSWTQEFKIWICDLISLSFQASFLEFRGDFYISKTGIPTGSTLSVDLANISVRYVLSILFEEDDFAREHVPLFLRLVDDGCGLISSSAKQNPDDPFKSWIDRLNASSLSRYNLKFTYEVNPINDWAIFLDIKFRYVDGMLKTDINIKITDACRYLEFSSFHPRHTFRSIVVSQVTRYYRIINDEETLNSRLDELKQYFLSSSYDMKMVNEVFEMFIRSQGRSHRRTQTEPSNLTPVYWVYTFGPGYAEVRTQVDNINKKFQKTKI